MSLFSLLKKKKHQEPEVKVNIQVMPEPEPQQEEYTGYDDAEYKKALQRYDEKQADKTYLNKEAKYYELTMKINEAYSVINNVGSFSDAAGDNLIKMCIDALDIEADIKEKREYYENHIFDMSPICKTLAMIYEKRGEYQRAATMCVYAIENGYPSDGTKGGMRGRLARMIKKGDLPLTDNLKNILNL